ncbi:META domain-containing protein [Sedimentitalea sp. CY04]|uniref:META domain-containing protein n=1 Tax=Parasedimentitalea denitrificans TaxID=2211118 RepID=A0ABX0WA35_9RHOB|nr:META domain-containing protein [Sedimentitalea sp. CY04]NIZ62482.1 META domain-containing protein [Sedimentitalea sp. CY04]
MLRTILLLTLILMTACTGDETVAAYGAAEIEWRLVEMDGQPFTATTTLHFPEQGRIAGAAPCNTFTATMDAPYPWFEIQELSLTRMACDDMTMEHQFLQTLQDMTLSEVSAGTMILSNVDGREMVFKAAE